MSSLPFNLKSKSALIFGLGLALFVAIRCIWAWQPQRQVERHQAALLEAIGDRDWKELDHLIADEFKHLDEYDKKWLLKQAGEVRRHFFVLTVRGDHPEITLNSTQESATVRALVRMEGNGTAVASYIMPRVNSAKDPFVFKWEKRSWKPWDWQLTQVEHPLLAHVHRESAW